MGYRKHYSSVSNTIIWIGDNCLISSDCKLPKGISKRNNYDSGCKVPENIASNAYLSRM